jgi:DNA excision repair protein ERCC-4
LTFFDVMCASVDAAMKAIQQAVLVAMDQCLTELKRTTNLDVSELTLENGIFKAFDALVRNQLAPEWHRISAKTKQVV